VFHGGHDKGIVILDLYTIGAEIEKVVLRFQIFPTKRENGGPDKTSFCEIVPGKDTLVCDEPKEGAYFWLVLDHPYFFPNWLLGEHV
jgi:hypothetical protein